jgi:hypothetical protein
MKEIKLNIKDVVKRNLNETRNKILEESFNQLVLSNTKENIVEKYINVSSQLIEIGYTNDEIQSYLNEAIELPFSDKVDYGKLIGGGIWSEVKEYAIRWILEALGMKGNLAQQLSIALADTNPLDLIRIFKNRQLCETHMTHIADSVVELLVRNLGGSLAGKTLNIRSSNVGTAAVGNIVGEAIRNSNIGESIRDVMCKVIHK